MLMQQRQKCEGVSTAFSEYLKVENITVQYHLDIAQINNKMREMD